MTAPVNGSIIKIRRSTTAGAVPSSLYAGELAINTNDRKLYSSDGATVFAVSAQPALANTNAFIKSQLANTNAYIATRASWTALTSTNTAIRLVMAQNLANTNAYIASAVGAGVTSYLQVANAVAIYATKATVASNLANTNSYISTVSTRERSALANTNIFIATKLNTTTFNSALANTNSYISTQAARITLVNTNLTGTNTAIRLLVSDRLQVANAVATYATKATVASNLANTNAYIASKLDSSAASSTYQTIAVERAALANTNAYIGTKLNTTTFNSALANTNAFIKTQLANTNSYIATKLNTTTFNSALANTNSFIGTKISNNVTTTLQTQHIIPSADITYSLGSPTNRFKDLYLSGSTIVLGNTQLRSTTGGSLAIRGTDNISRILVSNSYVTSTFIANTAARLLINDRLQVANAAATYQTKVIERAALANTNSYIATRASWSALTSTNTAIRTLVSDRLQVANAASIYATKINPTTSGILAHTGRATISTNLTVSGNTTISQNLKVDGNLDVNGTLTYINTQTIALGDNMIKVANNNTGDSIDMGMYQKYVSSGMKYTGVIRDATDGVYKFFYGLSTEPDQTIDFTTTTMATIQAVIDGGTY